MDVVKPFRRIFSVCTRNNRSHRHALTLCENDETLLASLKKLCHFASRMPVAPSLQKSIQAVRKAIVAPDPKDGCQLGPYRPLHKLLRNPDKIGANLESIEAFLALAPEIEAFRGKGSQMAANLFAQSISSLIYSVEERLPLSQSPPDLFIKEVEGPSSAKDAIDCLEKLADYAFSRTQGTPVKSRRAGELRATAWGSLTHIAETLRRPEHLAHSLKVAADKRASIEERITAVEFLSEYWGSEDPDAATANLLSELEKDSPDRSFLVTVLRTQINLGLGDELGALFAVEEWDDNNED